MKKMNKKGFTLAELLIVIAIIAVLIAIAIPTFSGALDNARLQTDHANIRSTYGMKMVAEMQGYIEADGDTKTEAEITGGTKFYFQKDGTLKSTDGNKKATAYVTQAKGDGNKCAASVPCDDTNGHEKGQVIYILYTAASGSTPASWTIGFEAPVD